MYKGKENMLKQFEKFNIKKFTRVPGVKNEP